MGLDRTSSIIFLGNGGAPARSKLNLGNHRANIVQRFKSIATPVCQRKYLSTHLRRSCFPSASAFPVRNIRVCGIPMITGLRISITGVAAVTPAAGWRAVCLGDWPGSREGIALVDYNLSCSRRTFGNDPSGGEAALSQAVHTGTDQRRRCLAADSSPPSNTQNPVSTPKKKKMVFPRVANSDICWSRTTTVNQFGSSLVREANHVNCEYLGSSLPSLAAGEILAEYREPAE